MSPRSTSARSSSMVRSPRRSTAANLPQTRFRPAGDTRNGVAGGADRTGISARCDAGCGCARDARLRSSVDRVASPSAHGDLVALRSSSAATCGRRARGVTVDARSSCHRDLRPARPRSRAGARRRDGRVGHLSAALATANSASAHAGEHQPQADHADQRRSATPTRNAAAGLDVQTWLNASTSTCWSFDIRDFDADHDRGSQQQESDDPHGCSFRVRLAASLVPTSSWSLSPCGGVRTRPTALASPCSCW